MVSRSIHLILVAIALIATTASSIRAQEESKWSSIKTIKPIEPAGDDDELRKLQKLRFNAALAEVEENIHIYDEGLAAGFQSLEAVFQSSQRLTDAAIDLHSDPSEQIKIYEGQLAMAKAIEQRVGERTRKGVGNTVLLHRATGYRLSAEIALLKARRALENAGKK